MNGGPGACASVSTKSYGEVQGGGRRFPRNTGRQLGPERLHAPRHGAHSRHFRSTRASAWVLVRVSRTSAHGRAEIGTTPMR
jgi:hypothetical protein